MRDQDWEVLMKALSIQAQAIHFSKGTSQEERNAIADHMIGVAEFIENHPQPAFVRAGADANIRLRKELDAALLQLSEAKEENVNLREAIRGEREKNGVISQWLVEEGEEKKELLRLNGEYRKALEAISAIRNRIITAGVVNWSADIYPLVAALEVLQTEKPKCGHDGGPVPCDHQKPCPDHSCVCGRAVAKRGDKCLRCGGFAEKRNHDVKSILCSKCGQSCQSGKHGSFLCEKCQIDGCQKCGAPSGSLHALHCKA